MSFRLCLSWKFVCDSCRFEADSVQDPSTEAEKALASMGWKITLEGGVVRHLCPTCSGSKPGARMGGLRSAPGVFKNTGKEAGAKLNCIIHPMED